MRRAALLSLLLLLGACVTTQREHSDAVEAARAGAAASKTEPGCAAFFVVSTNDWDNSTPRHSCWHRLWEVPAAAVIVPLALGLITSPVWVPILLLR